MHWVLVNNDQFKLNKISNILANNGFGIHMRQINFDMYYCFNVPLQYDIEEFVKKLPIVNNFIFEDRTIMIKL